MSYKSHYSGWEKMLHVFAFQTRGLQIAFADIENWTFKRRLSQMKIREPVFVTALPRAGTTLLLELLFKTSKFVSHTYRDMPFLLTPIIWNNLTKLERQRGQKMERAHGDGMLIDFESPEAFDEMIWMIFWKSRYRDSHINPTFGPSYPDFEEFYKNHIKKLILARSPQPNKNLRYLAKNNLFISRLNYLKKLFPDAKIIILFRSPIQHCSSLLRQHLNFLDIHSRDQFAKKYMRDIGHFDFGENLRPVNFNVWLSNSRFNPKSLNFWLLYWASAYEFLLNNAPGDCCFICYDDLCEQPHAVLSRISNFVGLANEQHFVRNANRIKSPKPYNPDPKELSDELLQKAELVYSRLLPKYHAQL